MKKVIRLWRVLAALSVVFSVPVHAAAATPTFGQEAQDPQLFAREIVLDMANFLAGLERFSVKVRGSYDAVQADGRKIEFLENMQVAVARPGQLRSDQTREDGQNTMVLFDGSQVTVWDDAARVYAQAPQPGSIDDAFVYFTRDLGMKLPLGSLLLQRLPEELEQRALSIDYVGFVPAPMFAVDAQHIAVRTAVADVQLWIADDLDAPWPLRMVLTYPHLPGQPQYRAEFSDWTTRPKLSKSHFQFKPPADAEQIVFSVQVLPLNQSVPLNSADPVGEQR